MQTTNNDPTSRGSIIIDELEELIDGAEAAVIEAPECGWMLLDTIKAIINKLELPAADRESLLKKIKESYHDDEQE